MATSRLLPLRAVAAGAALLTAACGPVHYRMPAVDALAPGQVSVVRTRRSLFGPSAQLWGVDGERAGLFTSMSEAELPPGPHLLHVGYEESGFLTQSHSIGSTPVCLVAEPGRRYEICAAAVPAEHFLQFDHYWRPWVVETEGGQVVSGFPAGESPTLAPLPVTLEVLTLETCWGAGTIDPQAAPRAAVADLVREVGGEGTAVACHGERVQLPDGDAAPREWVARFASVGATIRPCLPSPDGDSPEAYDHAIARRIVRHIPGALYVSKQQLADTSDAAGVGLDLAHDGDALVVVEPIAGGPAARAGVFAGDRLDRIGDVAMHGLPIRDVIDLLRGPKGTTVTLTVSRAGEPHAIPVTRDVVQFPGPSVEWLAGDVGYVRLRTLEQGADEQFAKVLKELRRARGVVVDLRGNGGGTIAVAVKVAGLLLPPGTPVLTTLEPDQGIRRDAHATREGGLVRRQETAEGGDALAGVPVVALIDQGAAGGATIVAAAWRTHRRATVVGASPGASDIQLRWFGLHGVAAVHLPVGHMLAADGRSLVEAAGPDVPMNARRPVSGRREDDAALMRAVAGLQPTAP